MRPLIIIGDGYHAKVLIELADQIQIPVLGVTSSNPEKATLTINNTSREIKILGNDDVILDYNPDQVDLAIGLAGITTMKLRQKIYNRFKAHDLHFKTLIHPSAIISPSAKIGEGSQILANSVIGTESTLGKICIVNTRSAIDHGCNINHFVNVACGVTISGNVSVGTNSYIGAGSIVVNNLEIGQNNLVAAGSTVIKSSENNISLKGSPARNFKSQYSLSQ